MSFLTEVPVYSPFFSMDLESRHVNDVLLYLENGQLYTLHTHLDLQREKELSARCCNLRVLNNIVKHHLHVC